MVTFHATVHDSRITLLSHALLCDLRVNPVGETPHRVVDFAEFNGSTGVVLDSSLEIIVEIAIVQEHVGVVIPAVEVALDRLDGLDNTIQLLIPREDDKGGVGPGL